MYNVSCTKSVNLTGTTMLFIRSFWCFVMVHINNCFCHRTPMPVLFSTSEATLVYCHFLMWLIYPVASAGCVVRPHPLGAGSFKLQFQAPGQMSCLPQFVTGWSCNLKGKKEFFRLLWRYVMTRLNYRFQQQTPMPLLCLPLLRSTPAQQQPNAADSIQ